MYPPPIIATNRFPEDGNCTVVGFGNGLFVPPAFAWYGIFSCTRCTMRIPEGTPPVVPVFSSTPAEIHFWLVPIVSDGLIGLVELYVPYCAAQPSRMSALNRLQEILLCAPGVKLD